ncbi:MAG: YceI family protein [Cyclobacteriaceae bacterium]|nr:YceI family protein [Cyclobacteriaceae bacterium]
MKKLSILMIISVVTLTLGAFKSNESKWVSSKTHLKFFSTTPAEDIAANNFKAVSTIDQATGEVVFSVPMQSFEFEKALMQKHFNQEDFLDTRNHPKAKLTGKITNLSSINWEKEGKYDAEINGELTIKGVTKPIREKGTITVSDNMLKVDSKFNVTLADHGIAFEKGKPSTNVAKTVEVTVVAEYQQQ